MQATIFTIPAIDGKKIFIRLWQPPKHVNSPLPKGIVHIFHNIAEHSGRYHRTAQRLCDAGYVVVAHDYRGHGSTASNTKELGRFADRHGWQLIISDAHAVNKDVQERFPEVPVIGLGHCIGASILQTYATRHPQNINAIALSAPIFSHPIFARMATLLASLEKLRLGRHKESRLIQQIVFGGFNRQAKAKRTPFDWLSRNPQVADSYMADPHCGFIGSTQMWRDILTGMSELHTDEIFTFLPTQIPYYLFTGSDDPISGLNSSMKRLIALLRQTGVTDLSVHIYPEGRHEMLHEVNHQEVHRDLIRWLDRVHHDAQQATLSTTISSGLPMSSEGLSSEDTHAAA